MFFFIKVLQSFELSVSILTQRTLKFHTDWTEVYRKSLNDWIANCEPTVRTVGVTRTLRKLKVFCLQMLDCIAGYLCVDYANPISFYRCNWTYPFGAWRHLCLIQVACSVLTDWIVDKFCHPTLIFLEVWIVVKLPGKEWLKINKYNDTLDQSPRDSDP